MSDTPEDYATEATERLLMKYDENRIPLTHVAQLQRDIRAAIVEAMEAQREACVQVWMTMPDYATVREVHLKMTDGLRAATVTVKEEEKK